MRRLALHWKILIGMVLGIFIGLLATTVSWGLDLVNDWIKPFGTIFIRLLKLIAVPLVIISLAKGITDFKDLTDLSKIGGRTILFYLSTTVIAVVLGLFLVNFFSPGANVSPETITSLSRDYTSSVTEKLAMTAQVNDKGPLDFFVELVPQNVFSAAGDNANML